MLEFGPALRSAKRDFSVFIHDIETWLFGLSPAEQVLGLCGFGLVLMWLMVRRPDNHDEDKGMHREFMMALAMVVIFGTGVGYVFGPGIATMGNTFT